MSKNRLFSVFSASIAIVLAVSALFTVPAAAANQNGNQGQMSIWCPLGVKPKPAKGGCTTSYATLGALAAALGSVAPANGVIWIAQGVDASASDIKIDGSVLTGLANDSLTLQGGWTGTPAGKVSGASVFSSPIYVLSWNNAVTVQNITVAHDGGASGVGIVTTGNIAVNHVTSDSNVAYGAALHSSAGAITVANSAFTNDAFTGLLADAFGNIAVSSVTASGNAGDGADLDTSGAISVNASTFNGNTAGDGAHLDNCKWNGSICTTTGSNPVSVVNSDFSSNTNGPGLAIDSKGAITLNGVSANSNSEEGGYLENDFTGTNGLTVSSSTFDNNLGSDGGSGLDAHTNGDAVVNCGEMSHNGKYGINASLSGGTITLNGVTLVGNTSGPYLVVGGTTVVNATCP